MRLTLEHLPKNLHETYNRSLTRIIEEDNDETCNKIFRYMAAAKRPLTLEEFGHLISWDPYQPLSMPECLVDNTATIVRWCHGLITMDDVDDTFQFAHSSVKEFFCSPEAERAELQSFHFPQDEADRRLGEVCVTCLSFNDFGTQLVESSEPKARLDPDSKMGASHTMSSGSPGDALDKAGDFNTERSKSPSANSKVLPVQSDQALLRDHPFIDYASEHWLSHTADFSPTQGPGFKS
jgi:hypothetical protein